MVSDLRKGFHLTLYFLLAQTFGFWQRLGIHVTPSSYLGPIPDTRTLGEDRWWTLSTLPGIDLREAAQMTLLRELSTRYRDEYSRFLRCRRERHVAHDYYLENSYFEAADAEVLYGLIRLHQPSRILEIGGGFSTCLSAQAVLRNQAQGCAPCEFTTVDPYPRRLLRRGFPGLTRLVPGRAQDLALAEFESLGADDILFIDSSHVLAIGSDVTFLLLEVLPRLRPGVLVHFHDIFLPGEYPREWIHRRRFFWNEQYALQAFLAHNAAFEVVWAGSFMCRRHPQILREAFPSVCHKQTDWIGPGSFWIRRM